MRGDVARETDVGARFLERTAPVRTLALGFSQPAVARMLCNTLDALALFGVADAYKRSSERYEVLGMDDSRLAAARELNDQYNAAGLRVLEQLRSGIARIREEGAEGSPLTPEVADGLLANLRRELAETDLYAHEAAQFEEQFRASLDAGRTGGGQALLARVELTLTELEDARRRPDRGGNPWWKGLALGLTAAQIFYYLAVCPNMPDICPDWVVALLTLGMLGGGVVSLLC